MKQEKKVTKKQYNSFILIVLVFFIVVLGVVVGMNIKNTMNLRSILTDSVKSQLISISLAAREMIDVDDFMVYDNEDVAELPEYQAILARLRYLCESVGAQYIYALKKQGNDYVFVFDTDTEDEEIFIPYDLSSVHTIAFTGKEAADIMNVDDDYGSFNTGAVPIWHEGQVVGIICTDIEDEYLEASYNTAWNNAIMLIAILLVTMLVMLLIVIKLLRRIRDMQQKLQQMALYDNVTGLPNRQYLMDYLAKLTKGSKKVPFALFFIDLDNFKKVNDNAGHDAGDELLRHIAHYLDGALENAKAFRPSAGQLNIAARVGGDEFIQVVTEVENEEQAAKLAAMLLENFKSQHIDRYVEKYNVGMSIGVALYPYHSDNFHVLIKYADTAMYYAKYAGKNQYKVYSDEFSKEALPDPGTTDVR